MYTHTYQSHQIQLWKLLKFTVRLHYLGFKNDRALTNYVPTKFYLS